MKKQASKICAEIVVAPYPSQDMTVEIELIKAALLYGDHVRLMSPASMLVSAAGEIHAAGWRDTAWLLHQIGQVVIPDDKLRLFRPADRRRRLSTKELRRERDQDRALRAELADLDGPVERLRMLLADFRHEELQPAIRAKLMTIERPEGLTTVSILNELLGQRVPVSAIDRYLEQLSTLAADRDVAAMMDRPLAEALAPIAQILDKIGLSSGSSSRASSTTVSSVAGLMASLPTFPDASIDEIVGIRDELQVGLARFRKAIHDATEDLDVFSSSFNDDMRTLWIEQVAPAIEQLQDDVRERRLAATSIAVGTGGLAVAATSLLQSPSVASVVAATGAAASTAAGYRAFLVSLRRQPFWYLYELDRRLK